MIMSPCPSVHPDDVRKRFGTKTSGEYLVLGGFMREISAQPPQTYRERFLSFASEDNLDLQKLA